MNLKALIEIFNFTPCKEHFIISLKINSCVLYSLKWNNGLKIMLESTVVCILVRMRCFPRFWRNHPYCRKKMIPHMNRLLVFIEMKQRFFFLFKMAGSKKNHFPAPPIFNIFSWKFFGLVLGLVGLIDAYGRAAVQHKLKNRQKMHFWCFQAVFELMSDSLTTI